MGAVYWSFWTIIGLVIGFTLIIFGGPWPVILVSLILIWGLGFVLFPKHLKRSGGNNNNAHKNSVDDPPLFV